MWHNVLKMYIENAHRCIFTKGWFREDFKYAIRTINFSEKEILYKYIENTSEFIRNLLPRHKKKIGHVRLDELTFVNNEKQFHALINKVLKGNIYCRYIKSAWYDIFALEVAMANNVESIGSFIPAQDLYPKLFEVEKMARVFPKPIRHLLYIGNKKSFNNLKHYSREPITCIQTNTPHFFLGSMDKIISFANDVQSSIEKFVLESGK